MWENLAQQGWEFAETSEGNGYSKALERDGLKLSFDGHWSVRQHFVSSKDGGWGNLQEIMSRVGLASHGNDEDLMKAAAHADEIKGYLDSWRWKTDVEAARHEGMENLRRFQREHGMTESSLSGKKDSRGLQTVWKSRISGWRGLQYWGVAVVAALYLVYWVASAADPLRSLMIVGVGCAMVVSGLFALRIRKKI